MVLTQGSAIRVLQGGQLVEERATTNLLEVQPAKPDYVHIK